MTASSPHPTSSVSGWLDGRLPLWSRILLLALCALIPTAYVAKQYQKRSDLTQMILFGEQFQSAALPEIHQLRPAVKSPSGYDGQFYAQMALDPSLRRPDMGPAMDSPVLRGQRIVLPALAHLLGLGSPRRTVQAYALLNLVFWYVLLVALVWKLRAQSIRHLLVISAILLGSGSIISIQRSLTDLPATVLGYLSLGAGEITSVILVSLAILTKPSLGVFLLPHCPPLTLQVHKQLKPWGLLLLCLLPPLLWQWHLVQIFGLRLEGTNNFTVPIFDSIRQLVNNWKSFTDTPHAFYFHEITLWEFRLFEVLGLASLMVQGAAVLLRPRWKDPLWVVAAGFSLMFFCLSRDALVEQISFTRTVLPLTLCFNLLLVKEKCPWTFFLLFFFGNAGLVLMLQDMIGFLFRS